MATGCILNGILESKMDNSTKRDAGYRSSLAGDSPSGIEPVPRHGLRCGGAPDALILNLKHFREGDRRVASQPDMRRSGISTL